MIELAAAGKPALSAAMPIDTPSSQPNADRDALCAMAGEVGHELNNLMTAVLAALEQLQSRAASPTRDAERERRLLARADAGARRAAALADRLLGVSRDGP